MDYRDRQQRPRAYNEAKQAHELTFSCYHRYRFLEKDRTCRWLADAIRLACGALEYSLWAYVFMPEHVHLIVYPRRTRYDTSELLAAIKEPVSRRAIAFLEREAPEWLERIRTRHRETFVHHFWQIGRGFDRTIENGRTLRNMIDYVHDNPLRRRLVSDPRNWTWSSAGWFVEQPLNDLKPDAIPHDWLED